MKATVKRYFVGLDREFHPGQTVDLPAATIEKLNSAGLGTILEVEEGWPKHVGGGHYELSNGEKVKGKEDAVAAQAEIDASVS